MLEKLPRPLIPLSSGESGKNISKNSTGHLSRSTNKGAGGSNYCRLNFSKGIDRNATNIKNA